MLAIFGNIKGLIKLEKVCIDNDVFRLHYKVTMVVLIMFSLIVTSSQYIGDPIDCMVDEIPQKVMDTYCWIFSTFTIPKRVAGRLGQDVAQPGVGPYIQGEDEVHYHKYYQWVCFTLFLQAMLFYVPRFLWKNWEGGRTKMLVLDLNCPIVDEGVKNDRKQLLVDYIVRNFNTMNFYAYRFVVCEYLNFANVVGQIFFIDYFLGGEFSTYGRDVWKFLAMEPEDREDPMAKVFPKVTKCTFHKYGPSGTVQQFDGLCVLPINIVNEKIYFFLWFWFIILAVITAVWLLYKLLLVFSSSIRMKLLFSQSNFKSRTEMESISSMCQIGDWFLLSQLGKNIDPIIFKQVLGDLEQRLKEKDNQKNIIEY